MTLNQKINANTPFLEGVPNSAISKVWYRILIGLLDAVTGQGTSIDLAELQVEFETSREPKDYSGEISELRLLQSSVRHAIRLASELSARIELVEEQLLRVRPKDVESDSEPALLRAKPSDAIVDVDLALLRRPAKIYAVPTGAAVATTAATNVGPYGYTTQAQADALVALANAMQQAGMKNNLFS